MKQRYQKREITDPESVESFVEQGMPRHWAEALSARGITPQNYEIYLGSVRHSPFEMKNMQEAVEIISYVLEGQGSILIYGDYDTDGLTASSILSLFFSDCGIENDVIIPTREQGYGLHADLVIEAFHKKSYDLVITVDCGISQNEDVAKIVEELDVDIIVTDHHELPAELPNCICVNPKMDYPFPNLAGAGVAWKLVEALAGLDVAAKYSDLAAVGTIGDVMPLIDENRFIVQMGLKNWNHKGLVALATESKCPPQVTVTDVGFKISSRINSAGRMGQPQEALKVLLSRDKANIQQVKKLNDINEKRKALVSKLLEEVEYDEGAIHSEKLVFAYNESWPRGILGVIAPRLKEKFPYPVVVMTQKDEQTVVGSGRSVDGVDLHAAMQQCGDLLTQFGGHKMSVGFSLLKSNLEEFHRRLVEALKQQDGVVFDSTMYYDADLDGITIADAYAFSQKLQPAQQNCFVFRVRDRVKAAVATGSSVLITLEGGLELKAFGKYTDYVPYIKNGGEVEALTALYYDDYSRCVRGTIEDLHIVNSVTYDEFYKLNFLENFQPKEVAFATKQQVEGLLQNRSVCVVFDDYETYLEQSKVFDLEEFYVDIFFRNTIFEKTVVISPLEGYRFTEDTVVYFCRKGMVRSIPNAVHFEVPIANANLYFAEMNRSVCATVFTKVKHKTPFDSLRAVYDKYLVGQVSYAQYRLALRILEELAIIKIVDNYTVEFLPVEKMDLTSSAIYRCFQCN